MGRAQQGDRGRGMIRKNIIYCIDPADMGEYLPPLPGGANQPAVSAHLNSGLCVFIIFEKDRTQWNTRRNALFADDILSPTGG